MENYKIIVTKTDGFLNEHNYTLDVDKSLALSFTKKNILFAFDDAETDRTISFSAPATANNNRIFELANNYAAAGGYARAQMPCQLQYSGGVIDGRLHINECEAGGAYKCILTIGELLPLKRLREAGTLASVLETGTGWPYTFTWEKTGNNDGDVVPNSTWLRCSLYNRNYSVVGRVRLPSYNLGYLLTLACNRIAGINFPEPAGGYANAWLLPPFSYNGESEGLVYPHRGNVVDYPALSYSARLSEQMPDWDCVELLQNYAFYTGLLPYISGTTIRFDDGTLTGWKSREIRDIISIGTLTRNFNDWAQRNALQFGDIYKTPDGREGNTIGTTYNISNRNIKEKNTLHEFGAAAGAVASGVQYIADVEPVIGDDDQPLQDPSYDYIVKAIYDGTIICARNNTTGYLERADIVKSPLIETLCAKSTSIKLKAHMTLRKYMSLDPRTLLYACGKRWVWTEAKWSKGACDMELSLYA